MNLPVLTVAVCQSDGAVFHLEKTPKRILEKLAYGNPFIKWRHVVRQILKHRRACKVQLIVGIRNNEFILDTLTYRLPNLAVEVVEKQ